MPARKDRHAVGVNDRIGERARSFESRTYTAETVAPTSRQWASPTQRDERRNATSTHVFESQRLLRCQVGSATDLDLSNKCATLVWVAMEWRRVWTVTAVSDDNTARRVKTAATVNELRALLAAARNNPAVWHVSFKPQRELIGDKPTHCRHGHPLATVGTLANPHDWLPCPCGGHWWIKCRDCGDEIVDPPPAYDCQPHRPAPRH